MRAITFGGLAFLLVVGNLEISAEMVTAGGNSYYIEREKQVNWHEAWNICASIQMNLVTMDSSEKTSQLQPHLKDNHKYWTSGNELAEPSPNNDNRKFVWFTTGLPFSNVNWGFQQPKNIGGCSHCMSLWSNATLYDSCCHQLKNFICEY